MKISEIIERIKSGECTNVTLVTHCSNPVMHSDEITATALLRVLFTNLGVTTTQVKTFKPAEEGYTDDTEDCVVYDIALGQYDHHHPKSHPFYENLIRPDGGKYASAGLIWKEIGSMLVPEVYTNDFYEKVIKFIDDQDNGLAFNPLSSCLSFMNMYNSNNKQECFETAVDIMIKVITGAINSYNDKYKEYPEVRAIIDSRDCDAYVITDKYYKIMTEELAKDNIPFYIFPDARSEKGYTFRTITPVGGAMSDNIIPIPDEVRHWNGITFLHPTCFLGTAVDKETAVNTVLKVYEEATK